MANRCSAIDAIDSRSSASADVAPHRHHRRRTATTNAAPQLKHNGLWRNDLVVLKSSCPIAQETKAQTVSRDIELISR
ncbi:hypothetical protein Taro_056123 [Colocasia esculenta]|uniref:Uncharacterized protein n=1 Tax=Colocasia esculenta TaxID=4460 RepID=A0A843XVD8_COLES|nr:hypothetical protein [Colocasia esculenta]